MEQRDRAYNDCDAAKYACYRGVGECDCVLNRLDNLARLRDAQDSQITNLEAELESLKQKYDTLDEKNNKLEQEKENSTSLILMYSENLFQLHARVSALESYSARPTNKAVGSSGNRM